MKTLAALLILLTAAATALADRIVLPAEAFARGETITLADLVDEAPKAWERVYLGASPRPGRSTVIEVSWLRAKVAEAGLSEVVAVAGPVKVIRPGRNVSREEVENAITEAVIERYGDKVMVRADSVNLPNTLPDGDTSFEVRLPRGSLPTRTTLWVDVLVDGKVQGRASARVESITPDTSYAVVLVRGLKKGERVRETDVALTAGRGRPGVVSTIEDAVGKVVTRTISAGSPLLAEQLSEPVVVKKGSMVKLVARVGGVYATTTAKASADASLGEAVTVENLTSGQSIRGVVREAGVVETLSQTREVN